jgi:iron-sulfur cluster repair protein YtfE (RIC family)
MNPIQHLLDEHQLIMAEIVPLRRAVADLNLRGDAALPAALPVLRRIGQMMETQLAAHAQKEDEALFPALEAIFGAGPGPTQVMRWEHRAIHGQGDVLRQTLRELNEIEHPRIVAGGERLRHLTTTDANANTLRATATDIIHLLNSHFGKEEQILFPMAENLLDAATHQAVYQKMLALHPPSPAS